MIVECTTYRRFPNVRRLNRARKHTSISTAPRFLISSKSCGFSMDDRCMKSNSNDYASLQPLPRHDAMGWERLINFETRSNGATRYVSLRQQQYDAIIWIRRGARACPWRCLNVLAREGGIWRLCRALLWCLYKAERLAFPETNNVPAGCWIEMSSKHFTGALNQSHQLNQVCMHFHSLPDTYRA